MGVNIKVKDQIKNTTFMLLAGKLHQERIISELFKDESFLDAKNCFGETALMLAITKGHSTIVKEIIEMKVDLNLQDTEGDTAIHRAIKMRKTKIVIYLI